MKFLPQRFSLTKKHYIYKKVVYSKALYRRTSVYNFVIYNIVAVLFLTFFATLVFVPKTFSQTPPPANDYANINAEANVDKNIHTLSQVVMVEILRGTSCFITGVDPLSKDGKCLGVNPVTGKYGYINGQNQGAIGVVGNLMSATYNIPVSSGQFPSYLASNFGVAKRANAQSPGFDGLFPVLELWKTFRNIAYLLFVLIFVVVGLGIMLRIKIDPRTVMTFQNQIPKIIISLILVTLSYAIVGFLIDIMFAFIYLMFNLIDKSTPTFQTNIFSFVNDTLDGPAGGGIFGIILGSSLSVGKIMTETFSGIFTQLPATELKLAITALSGPFAIIVGPVVGGCDIADKISIPGGPGILDIPFLGGACNAIDNLPQLIVGGIAGIIAFLVIGIAVLWALFRTWFMLLRAYIFLLLDVILAPLWISVGILPGAGGLGFSKWFRHTLSNIAVFPITIGMYLVGDQLIKTVTSSPSGFVPPLIGNPSEGSALGAIIGLGIILSTPQAIEMSKNAFKAPRLPLVAIGQALGAGGGIVRDTTSTSIGAAKSSIFGNAPSTKTGRMGILAYLGGKFGR